MYFTLSFGMSQNQNTLAFRMEASARTIASPSAKRLIVVVFMEDYFAPKLAQVSLHTRDEQCFACSMKQGLFLHHFLSD